MTRMISRHEAAQLLEVHDQTVSNWVKKGILKGRKMNRTLRVDKSSIECYFNSLKDIGSMGRQLRELQASLSAKKKELQSALDDMCSAQELLGVTIPKPLFRQLLHSILAVAGDEVLTPRERDILDKILDGTSLDVIAMERGINRSCVVTLASKSMRKVMCMKSFSEMRSENRKLIEENDSCHKVIFSLQQRNTELEGLLLPQVTFVNDFDLLQGTEPGHITQLLNTKVTDMDFSTRALNCLKNSEIMTLGDLVALKKSDLLKFRNLGHHSLAEIEEQVESLGLKWGMNVSAIIAIDLQRRQSAENTGITNTKNLS